MDRVVTATEANRAFSELLRAVANGNAYIVTSRGRAVAHVTPIRPSRSGAVASLGVDADRLPSPRDLDARKMKVRVLIDELLNLPVGAPGRITRDDGYE